jgi:hypothetical protein
MVGVQFLQEFLHEQFSLSLIWSYGYLKLSLSFYHNLWLLGTFIEFYHKFVIDQLKI